MQTVTFSELLKDHNRIPRFIADYLTKKGFKYLIEQQGDDKDESRTEDGERVS
jgi:hypothetical protein